MHYEKLKALMKRRNLYIYKSRSLKEVLPRYVKSLSKKLTRMKFTYKISYGAMSEAPFQTNTHLSLKKRKKKKENTV